MQRFTNNLTLWLCFLMLMPLTHGYAQELVSALLPQKEHHEGVQSEKSVSLKKVLSDLSEKYSISLNYNPQLIKNVYVDKKLVGQSYQDMEENLQVLLKSVGFEYKKIGKSDFVIKPSEKHRVKKLSTTDQKDLLAFNGHGTLELLDRYIQVNVRGTVTGEDGNGLPGVNVLEKGTTNGTITDVDGNYSISVAGANAVLVFSSIGFATQEIEVGNRQTLNVRLETDTRELSEVVVTALGVEREEKALGYSVAKLDGSQVSNVKETNVINALAGKVAGVNVRNASPDAGSTALITIRGQSSLTGDNQPLFVIDGVPIANTTRNNMTPVGRGVVDYGNAAVDINPDDIESISVLKGASAAALYGTRAGNGVILITTKSGKGNRRGLGVDVNSTAMFDQPWQFPHFQNEFGAGDRPGTEETISGASWGPRLDIGTQHVQWDSPLDENGNPIPTDWVSYPDRVRDFYETGRTLTNNVSLTGRNDEGNFRLSYTNMNNKGIVPNTDLYRNTFNLNAGYNFTEKFKVNTSVTYTNTGSNNRPSGDRGSVNETVYTLTPNVDIEKLRNYWVPGREGIEQFSHRQGSADNPFLIAYEHINAFSRNRITGNIQASYQFTPSLSLMLRTGMDQYNEERESRRPFSSIRNQQGAYSISNLYFNERNSDFLLTYQKDVSSDWFVSVSAGGNQMDRQNSDTRQHTESLVLPAVYHISNASGGSVVNNQFKAHKRINSLYGMGQIAYKNMLFLDITGRNDWSSTLPPENNSFFYPSVSFSAVISDIFELPAQSVLSFAKLRANWAQVGNDTDPYQLYNTYQFANDWGGVKRATLSSFVLKNSQLKPEIATSYEFGTDLRFFEGRLGLDVTYYNTSNRNQIIEIPTVMSSGSSGRLINAGEIQNKGWEIGLTATPVNGAFRWETMINFTKNQNKVVELYHQDGIDITEVFLDGAEGSQYLAREGEELGQIYSRTWERVPEGPHAGEPLLEENGEYIRSNDYTPTGSYNPDFLVGFTNTFTFKNFTLYALLDWRQGGVFYSYTAKNLLSDGRTEVTLPGRDPQTGGLTWVDDQGRERTDGQLVYGYFDNGDGTYTLNDHVILGPEPYYGNYYWSFNERTTFDASFVKLREVSLSYTFDNALLGNSPIRNISVALIGRNFLQWTAADQGYDPETSNKLGGRFGIQQGIGTWTLPNTRSFGFKVGFSF